MGTFGVDENNNNSFAGDVPYSLSIDKMRKVMKDVLMSPLEKLLELRSIMQLIRIEISDFWAFEQGAPTSIERSDMLSILVYILVNSQLEDLFAQLILLREFVSI